MKIDKVSSIFWMVFGIIVLYSSYHLKIGTLAHPGPGFLPFLSGLILCVISLIVFLRGWKHVHDPKTNRIKQLWAGMNWPKTIIITGALLFYTFILTHLGFLLSTILLLIFLFRIVEPVRWFVAVGGGLIATFVSYAIFVLWLQVQLPRGIIERIWF